MYDMVGFFVARPSHLHALVHWRHNMPDNGLIPPQPD